MNRPDCGQATNSVQKVGNAGMTKESHAFIPAGICVTSAYVRHHEVRTNKPAYSRKNSITGYKDSNAGFRRIHRLDPARRPK